MEKVQVFNEKFRVIPGKADFAKRNRPFSLEINGLIAEFDKNSKEAKMNMRAQDIERHFLGANFAFVKDSSGDPEFLDYAKAGSFVMPEDLIAQHVEMIGISKKGLNMSSKVGNMPGLNKKLYLGGRQKIVDAHYKVKGEGGKSKLETLVLWSPFSILKKFTGTEIRTMCNNGMNATNAVADNFAKISNDFEYHLEMAEERFADKVIESMNNRYERLMTRALTVRQVKELVNILYATALKLRANGLLDQAYRNQNILQNVKEVMIKTYQKQGLNDRAFGGAPTRIPAIQSVDTLTQILTHDLSVLPDSGGYSLLSSTQKLINDLVFNDPGIFVMPELDRNVETGAEIDFHGGRLGTDRFH